ncbi:hypothetical protein PCANC_05736 [Puccinia coronata f. sp. avenae]|uniref:Uncharacterized protein n=1 Tax=Puccinia coronata f. sp. avenae TaxID=200324 RepID=A0A2N5VSG7_9BASI|nr:hypothetical protein PCANC_05736 [Puccinia coronata f. sp. avenae]
MDAIKYTQEGDANISNLFNHDQPYSLVNCSNRPSRHHQRRSTSTARHFARRSPSSSSISISPAARPSEIDIERNLRSDVISYRSRAVDEAKGTCSQRNDLWSKPHEVKSTSRDQPGVVRPQLAKTATVECRSQHESTTNSSALQSCHQDEPRPPGGKGKRGTTSRNYNQLCGEVRQFKIDSLSEIVKTMEEHGIHHRDIAGVRRRFCDLRYSYKKALDWRHEKGDSILMARGEANGVEIIQRKLLKLCPHWEVLNPLIENQDTDQNSMLRAGSTNTDATDQPNSRLASLESDQMAVPEVVDTSCQANTPEQHIIVADTDAADQPNSPASAKSEETVSELFNTVCQANTVIATTSTTGQTKSQPSSNRSKRATKGKVPPEERHKAKSTSSKRQVIKATQARLAESKLKLEFMKELRKHNLPLEEIEKRVAKEFPTAN